MLIAAVIGAVVAGWDDLRGSVAALRSADLTVMALGAAAQLGAMASLPQVYRSGLRTVGGGSSYRAALGISLQAFALSRLLPAGGAAAGVVAARRFSQLGTPVTAAVVGVFVAGTCALVALAGLVTLGTTTAAASGVLPWAAVVAPALLTALLVGALGAVSFALRAPRLQERVGLLLRRLSLLANPDEPEPDVAAVPRPDGRALVPVVAWSGVAWMLELAALGLALMAVGQSPHVGVLLLALGSANLATALPHLPGGLGLVEAGMTAVLVTLGTPAAAALGGVLCYRLLSYWLPVGVGLGVMAFGRRVRS